MDISVIIPTHGQTVKLAQCLRALAMQTLDQARFEVLIGLDGPDEHAVLMAADVWSEEREESLRIVECPRAGASATRNRLIKLARAPLALFLSDQSVPAPDCLRAHLKAHSEAGRGVLVAGETGWRIFPSDTLFDRLVRESPLVIPHISRGELAPEHGSGRVQYRAWSTVNGSAPLDPVRSADGFAAGLPEEGYHDVELAFRLRRRFDIPVVVHPEAAIMYDRRFTPRKVLERAFHLGRAAWECSGLNPEFGVTHFGVDVRSPEEVAYCRQFVRHEREVAERVEETFCRLPALGPGVIPEELVSVLFEQQLLASWWRWRSGLLAQREA